MQYLDSGLLRMFSLKLIEIQVDAYFDAGENAYFEAEAAENTYFDENTSFAAGVANFDADEDDQWSPQWGEKAPLAPSLPPPGQRPNVTAHYTAP